MAFFVGLFALNGCATCMWCAIGAVGEGHSDDEVVVSELYNLTYRYPGYPWVQVELHPNEDKNHFSLQLLRFSPVVSLYVVGFEVGNPDVTPDTVLNEIRTTYENDYKDVHLQKNKPLMLSGVKGSVLAGTMTDEDGDVVEVHIWAGAKNGFLYKLILTGTDMDAEVVADAFAGFAPRSPTQLGSGVDVVESNFSIEGAGLQLRLPEGEYAKVDYTEDLPMSVFSGARIGTGRRFSIVVIPHLAGTPRREALERVGMAMQSWDFPDEKFIRDESPALGEDGAKQEGVTSWGGAIDRDLEGGKNIKYRFRYLQDATHSVVVVHFGKDAKKVEEERFLLDKALFLTPLDTAGMAKKAKDNTAAVAKKAKDTSNSVHKNFALALLTVAQESFEGHQFEEAVAWTKAARALHDDEDSRGQLLIALGRAAKYEPALQLIASLKKEEREQSWIRSWQAWHLVQLARNQEAIAIYQILFSDEKYRDDDDLVRYSDLLLDAGKREESNAQWERYLKGKSALPLRLKQAEALYKRGELQMAIDVLRLELDSARVEPKRLFALLRYLLEQRQFAEAEPILAQLIDGGYQSADAQFYKGRIAMGLGNHRRARDAFLKVKEMRPKDPHVQAWLDDVNGLLGEGSKEGADVFLSPLPLPKEVQELAMQKREVSKDATSVFFDYDIEVVRVGQAASKSTRYRRFKVLSASAKNNFAVIRTHFSPGKERVFVNRLEVRDAQGKLVAELAAKDTYIVDKSKGATGARMLHAPVPRLEKGHVVEVVVTREDLAPGLHNAFDSTYFVVQAPTALKAYVLVGALDNLAIDDDHGPERLNIEDGIAWVSKNPPLYKRESLNMPLKDAYSWVQIGDKRARWKKLGLDYQTKITSKRKRSDTTRELAISLTLGARSSDEKLRRILRYVQRNVRYEAVEFGVRGVIPKLPDATLKDGYGDCKDTTVLLEALFAEVGISSNPALISFDAGFNDKLPSRSQFDHMVLYLPRQKRFIDATDKEFSLNSTAPIGLAEHQALVLSKRPKLVSVSDYQKPSKVEVSRVVHVVKRDAQVKEDVSIHGYYANFLRGRLRGLDDDGRLNWLRSVVTPGTRNPRNLKLEIKGLDDNDAILKLEIEYLVPRAVESQVKGRALRLPSTWERYYFDFHQEGARTKGLYIPYALEMKTQTEVQMQGKKRMLKQAAHLSDAKLKKLSVVKVEAKKGVVHFYGKLPSAKHQKDQWKRFQSIWQDAFEALERPRVFAPLQTRSPDEDAL